MERDKKIELVASALTRINFWLQTQSWEVGDLDSLPPSRLFLHICLSQEESQDVEQLGGQPLLPTEAMPLEPRKFFVPFLSGICRDSKWARAWTTHRKSSNSRGWNTSLFPQLRWSTTKQQNNATACFSPFRMWLLLFMIVPWPHFERRTSF